MKRKHYDRSHDLAPGDSVWIYAIRCELFVKIGIATNIADRLSGMQTGNPFEIELLFKREIQHEAASFAEHWSHEALAAFHHRGEWFKCSRAEAYRCVSIGIRKAKRLVLKGGVDQSPRSEEFLRRAAEAIALADDYKAKFLGKQNSCTRQSD